MSAAVQITFFWYYATCSKRRLTETTLARGQLAEPVSRRTDGRTSDPRKSFYRRQLAEPVGRNQIAEFGCQASVYRFELKIHKSLLYYFSLMTL